ERELPIHGRAWRLPRVVEALDRLLERLPFDESHRIIRAAIGMTAQAIDRHDPRVLQPPGDLRFQQEPRLADRVMGVVAPQLLQRDLAVQLGVQGQEDLAQPPARVGPDNAEPPVGGRRHARAIPGTAARGAVGVLAILRGEMRFEMGDGGRGLRLREWGWSLALGWTSRADERLSLEARQAARDEVLQQGTP